MKDVSGKSLAKQFKDTWDSVYAFYGGKQDAVNTYSLPEMLKLIQHLRGKGYSSGLRAGTQVGVFILSRAKYYGLALQQPSIRIHYSRANDYCFDVIYHAPDQHEEFKIKDCEDYTEIIRVIEQLLKYPIDEGEYQYLFQFRHQSSSVTNGLLKYITITTESEGTEFKDATEPLRTALINLLYKYEVTKDDMPLVRFLLRQEMIFSEHCWCVADIRVAMLCDMLSYFGNLDDLFLLWEAKYWTFDLSISIGAEFFFGNDYASTVSFLMQSEHDSAKDILEYIQSYVTDGQISEYIQQYQAKLKERFSSRI